MCIRDSLRGRSSEENFFLARGVQVIFLMPSSVATCVKLLEISRLKSLPTEYSGEIILRMCLLLGACSPRRSLWAFRRWKMPSLLVAPENVKALAL